MRLRGGVFGAELNFVAAFLPLPNAVNVHPGADVCLEVDLRGARAQLMEHLGRGNAGAGMVSHEVVQEQTLRQLNEFNDTCIADMEFSVVRVRCTVVRRIAGVVERWDRGEALGALLALRQHAIPAELARMVLSRLVLTPEEYEDGIAVPVRATLALHSLGTPGRFKLTCRPVHGFSRFYNGAFWEQNSHYRVDVSTRWAHTNNRPNEFPFTEPDAYAATHERNKELSGLCRSWHFYTGARDGPPPPPAAEALRIQLSTHVGY